MNNRHALIEARTGLVRNIVIWEGAVWLPPKGHYVINNCAGQIGDYWDQSSNSFYTIDGKKRILSEDNKVSLVELLDDEKLRIQPILDSVFKEQRQYILDMTKAAEQKE